MQSVQDNHAFEMSLRDQLIAAQNGQPPPNTQAAAQPADQYPPPPQHSTHPGTNLDPSIAGQHMAPYAAMPPAGRRSEEQDGSPASKKNAPKARELSTTKRAAQNRAAQRAFRQRKEQYILKLEEDVKNYQNLEDDVSTLQADNNALRSYIMDLQGKLLEAKIDFAPAPSTARVARVAQPNPVVYDLSESSPPAPARRPRQPAYATSSSPVDQQYYPVVDRQYPDHQQHDLAHPLPHSPKDSKAYTHNSSLPTDNLRSDASHREDPHEASLAPHAISQLRAAAAQAGELGDAHSRALPEDYKPANENPHPHKRARRNEEDIKGGGGTAVGVLASIVSKFHAFTKPTTATATAATAAAAATSASSSSSASSSTNGTKA